MGPRDEPFEALLADGQMAYAAFHRALAAPAAHERDMRGRGLDELFGPETLPPPHPSLPLRVLASLAHHARNGNLETRYLFEPVSNEGLRALSDWQVRNYEQLQRYVPEAIRAEPLWLTWEPPHSDAPYGAGRLELDELRHAVGLFLAASHASSAVMGLVFVLLRDWYLDLVRPLEQLRGDAGGLVARACEMAVSGRRDPDLDWAVVLAHEQEARERLGTPTSAWTLLHACASADALELLDLSLTGERVDEALTALVPEQARRGKPAEQPADDPADVGDAAAARGDAFRPSTAISTDAWTVEDRLQYDVYAEAITRFILDERTRAPLTIGIKAPWGAGKTSLMRMIRRRLDPEADGAGPARGADGERLSNREVLKTTALPREQAAEQLAIDGVDTRAQRTSVWFNAWKYQSGEQLWAGLAHAIVSQVEARMRPWERERFWASLNIRRVDLTAVRRRIYRAFLLRAIPDLLLVPLALLLALATALVASAAAGGLTAVATALGLGLDAARRWRAFAGESVAASDPKLVADPGYEDRLGFLHLVHEDMHRILALVASPERPLVVFVDDLDRCSYTTVVQVIEGLNTFLAGDFESCIFVIAMEPDLVAAQIHVAYADLFARIAERDGSAGSDLAWRFLEKMVQLPLALPPPGEPQIERYVQSLVASEAQAQVVELDDDDEQLVAARSAIRSARVSDSLGGIADALERASETLDRGAGQEEAYRRALLQRAARIEYASEFDDGHPEVRAMLQRHAAALHHNPREIKRFVNVFRFYAYVQFWRTTDGLPAPDLDGAAKLATLAVRCPHLLSALGAVVEADGERRQLLAWLERIDGDATLEEKVLGQVPGYVRDALAEPGLRSLIVAPPAVGEQASGFL
ncbi:MAG: hypothetical protein JSS99_14085 [Actinobacteria bacterium]|nr:hypothetical protein [Actinomycetota bacterium]